MNNKNNGLPDKILKWVVETIDVNSFVQSIVRLKGSTTSTLHRITLQRDGKMIDVVVRQFDNKEWLKEEHDLAFHEAESLRLATEVGIETPEIIAFEEEVDRCGVPVVLMSLLDGEVNLKPHHMERWLARLAKTLIHVHEVKAESFGWEYYTYNNMSHMVVPEWSGVQELWARALEIAKNPRPKFEARFIHRDYHPANVLWKNDEVSGVVDWVNACRGPAGVDVGHCRVNLAMLYDVQAADGFLMAYQQNTKGVFKYDVYWDVISLFDILFGLPTVYPGWEAFGVTGLTDKMMEKRLDKYVESLVARL